MNPVLGCIVTGYALSNILLGVNEHIQSKTSTNSFNAQFMHRNMQMGLIIKHIGQAACKPGNPELSWLDAYSVSTKSSVKTQYNIFYRAAEDISIAPEAMWLWTCFRY